MSTTRHSSPLRRMLGLAAVPALLVAAAGCGGDDDSAGGSFCDDARELDDQFTDVDPTSESFGDAIDAFAELDPPAEIEDSWNTFVDTLQQMQDIDLTDPDAAPDLAGAEEAFNEVDEYMTEECDL